MTEERNLCMHQCKGCTLKDCPLIDEEELMDKDRSIARRRHLASVKAKEASLDVVDILSSKADRIPDTSKNSKKLHRADQRVNNAARTSMRYKKQVAEREA